jgi:hypothetical protein
MAAKSNRNSMITRNGRTKMGPLSVQQLTKLLENSSTRTKTKAKLANRIRTMKARVGYVEPVTVEA